MIRDVSQTLRAILTQSGVPSELRSAQIVFDRPTEQFKPSQTSVDLFLYDIRENLDLRRNESTLIPQNGKVIFQVPPVRLDCSYLVTAWPVGVSGDELFLQEHRLLGQAFQVLAGYPIIPNILLQGSLRDQEPPILPPVSMVTSHIDSLKTTGEFWTALGNQLRPSISVTVTISLQPIEPEKAEEVPLVIVLTVQWKSLEDLSQRETTQIETFQIGGQLTGADRRPIAAATITLSGSGLTTTTDKAGRYYLAPIAHPPNSPPLVRNLQVQVGASTRTYPITIPPPNSTSYNLQFA
jgi:hypothetical protein